MPTNIRIFFKKYLFYPYFFLSVLIYPHVSGGFLHQKRIFLITLSELDFFETQYPVIVWTGKLHRFENAYVTASIFGQYAFAYFLKMLVVRVRFFPNGQQNVRLENIRIGAIHI